ncbi:hypothetical protein Xsto_03809 [Xenorhabdus stockiae]|uniref:Uncharacterized protein n=1 Tax=Xenorhabdus stockiae TaxID=351614 RepID=A0A2D0KBB1_9GAMM|nr:hypothetical protein [Xenorhabdus stockiae]PHM60652.1 hypothetical protein Xsto_03809 [Xenorhabdus stockiae]
MMIIHINEDGSTSVQTARYMASYDKEGVLIGVIGFTEFAPKSIDLHNAFKSKADTARIASTDDKIEVRDLEGQIRTVIGSLQSIKTSHDDHIRQIVREELRQFVTRELMPGGLLSR